jgi:hypothetical protein
MANSGVRSRTAIILAKHISKEKLRLWGLQALSDGLGILKEVVDTEIEQATEPAEAEKDKHGVV